MNPYRRQAGAAGLTAIVALSMAVIFAALAIDVGRLSWEAKQLQNVANLAALDAMDQAGPCSGVTTLDQTALENAAQTSAGHNGYGGDLSSESGVAAGSLASVGGKRSFVAGGNIADATAVQITASKTITSSLVAGGWLGGTTTLQRRAVAYGELLSAFSAGSFVLSVNNNDSVIMNALLSGLLGGGVNLNAASYQTLADSEVSLESLASAAGLAGISDGSMNGFLTANVTAGDFLQIIAGAVGSGHSAYANINGLASVTTNANNFSVSDLIKVTADTPQLAAKATLNVFGLISGAAQISNENVTVTLPLTLSLPLGLGDVTVLLHIAAGPQYAVGPPGLDSSDNWKTDMQTGQAQFVFRVALDNSDSILGGLVAVSGDLLLFTNNAPGGVWLENIRCASAGNLTHEVNFGAQTSASELGIGQFNDISDPASGTAPSPTLNIDVASGLVNLNADVSATLVSVPAQTGQVSFSVNHDNPLPQTATASPAMSDTLNNGTGSLASSLNVTVSGGGALVDALLGAVGLSVPVIETGLVNELLSPLLISLDELLLEPLLRAMGMNFGGNDVTLQAIQNSDPRLAG